MQENNKLTSKVSNYQVVEAVSWRPTEEEENLSLSLSLSQYHRQFSCALLLNNHVLYFSVVVVYASSFFEAVNNYSSSNAGSVEHVDLGN